MPNHPKMRPETLSTSHFPSCLRPRPADSHKGTFGSAGIIGGSIGMGGALLLAARSALLLGAGRVFAAFLDETAPSFDSLTPELMIRSLDALYDTPLTALAIGPGLGMRKLAKTCLEQALSKSIPLVIDADALNLIAQHPSLLKALNRRSSPSILTPHPAEAARLLNTSIETVQAHRPQACSNLVELTGAHVLLKGHGSLIGSPDKKTPIFLNPTGNPGMAAAGMGDVLSGMITALLAQGFPADESLRAGVFIHGQAADDLVAAGIGPIGLSASEVAQAARQTFNRLIKQI
jgi:ADP-dependent NAD(P)H-hydrate dehydratase / NAD(P)H-hydrate epimerase